MVLVDSRESTDSQTLEIPSNTINTGMVVAVNNIMRMEEMVAIANENNPKFREVRTPWIEFLDCPLLLSFIVNRN